MLSARRRRRAAKLACLVALSTVIPGLALAADAPKSSPEATAAAHQHATRAHELYQQGAYHDAIAELEAALKLDPNGKDLVFNLGVVHEKLGNIADALRYFERYEQMDLDPPERARANTYLKRLQGARKEVEKPVEPPPPSPIQPPPPPPPAEKHYGRFDWVTGVSLGLSAVAAGIGTGAGVKALADRPKTGVPTTDTRGYAQVQAAETTAHREAIFSDVSFAIAAAGVTATAILFFARTRDSASPKAVAAGSSDPPVVISCTPLARGGAVWVEARF